MYFVEDGFELLETSPGSTVTTLSLTPGHTYTLGSVAVDHVGNSANLANLDTIEVYVPIPEGLYSATSLE